MAWITLQQADDYFDGTAQQAFWALLSVDERNGALGSATNRLESIPFQTDRTDRSQARYSDGTAPNRTSTTIPLNLLQACCETALWANRNSTTDLPTADVVAGLSNEANAFFSDLPIAVQSILLQYVKRPDVVRNKRRTSTLSYTTD